MQMPSRSTLRPAVLRTPIVRDAPAYVVAVLLLCLPAVWNGFPLMFDDVGGYLERWWPSGSLALGRSTVYGLLIWLTRSTLFAPVIALQALVTAFVIDRAIRASAPGARRQWLLPAVVAAVAVVSGAALFVSKPIPDAWAAPAVLALHLLVWRQQRLRRWERLVMAAIIGFAGAAHMCDVIGHAGHVAELLGEGAGHGAVLVRFEKLVDQSVVPSHHALVNMLGPFIFVDRGVVRIGSLSKFTRRLMRRCCS
jgi:hypothetical protein